MAKPKRRRGRRAGEKSTECTQRVCVQPTRTHFHNTHLLLDIYLWTFEHKAFCVLRQVLGHWYVWTDWIRIDFLFLHCFVIHALSLHCIFVHSVFLCASFFADVMRSIRYSFVCCCDWLVFFVQHIFAGRSSFFCGCSCSSCLLLRIFSILYKYAHTCSACYCTLTIAI